MVTILILAAFGILAVGSMTALGAWLNVRYERGERAARIAEAKALRDEAFDVAFDAYYEGSASWVPEELAAEYAADAAALCTALELRADYLERKGAYA